MNNTKRTDLYLTIVSLLTLVGTVVQAILLLHSYDPTLLLYDHGTPAYLIPAVVLVILFLSATVFLTLPGGKLQIPPKATFENHDSAHNIDLPSILLKIGALFLLIGAILSGFLLFYGDFPVDHAHDLWQNAANGSTESSVKMAGTLLKYSAFVGILAAVFPALLLIIGKGSPLSALTTVIWLLLLDLSVYFDNSTVLNDPCRSLEILGLSAAILWLLVEIKRLLGSAGRRTYTFLSLSAFGILCISAIPRLIASASGQLNFNSRTLIPVAMLGIAGMIAGRLCGLRNLPDPDPEPEAKPAADAEPDPTALPNGLLVEDGCVIENEEDFVYPQPGDFEEADSSESTDAVESEPFHAPRKFTDPFAGLEDILADEPEPSPEDGGSDESDTGSASGEDESR